MNWQTIDSAPKGYAILIWLPVGRPAVGHWEKQGHHDRPRPYWTCSDEYIFGRNWMRANQPTHWQPLPAPPSQERT